MPIYEYRCKKCGSHFEKRQSISEEPLKVCEHCEGELEKQWSLSGFAFKGEGWYVTDYAGKKGIASDSKASGEKSSGGESTASTDSASKSKSETSTAAKSDSGTSKD
jgi:putative FmdB family regulatory protein